MTIDGFIDVAFLPVANEIWGKVIFLHLFVILFTGRGIAWSRGCLVPGGVPDSRGVCSQGFCSQGDAWSGGCVLPGVPGPWGAWLRPPSPRQLLLRYASYWNAFLFTCFCIFFFRAIKFVQKVGPKAWHSHYI